MEKIFSYNPLFCITQTKHSRVLCHIYSFFFSIWHQVLSDTSMIVDVGTLLGQIRGDTEQRDKLVEEKQMERVGKWKEKE